jgi:hypothetical protein
MAKGVRTTGINYFIDEAHLILTKLVKALLKQIETVVKINSFKRITIFVTQNPMNISSGVNTIGAKTQMLLALLSLTIDNRYSEQRTTTPFVIITRLVKH